MRSDDELTLSASIDWFDESSFAADALMQCNLRATLFVHQPKKSGSRRFCDFLKRERKVQGHAGLDSAENSTFPHSGATLREAGRPLRHVIVGSDPQPTPC